LSRQWARKGSQPLVHSAGQNRRVPVFGALELSGQLSCMIAQRKRSAEFLHFLHWLNEDVYTAYERIYLFMDNSAIHKTKAVQAYIAQHSGRLRIIWNAAYAPNLNDIEHVWGQLKRASTNNYYFKTVENLERAVLRAVSELNRKAPCKTKSLSMFHPLPKAA